MANPFVGAISAHAVFSGSVFTNTVINPTGILANDFLVAHVTNKNGDPSSVTNNNGLTLWGTAMPDPSANQLWQAIYTKVATGGEGASTLFTFVGLPGGQESQIFLFWVRGAHPTTPRDGNPAHASGGSSAIAPSVTVTNNESLFLVLSCIDNNTQAAIPAGMQEGYDRETPDAEAPGSDLTGAAHAEFRNAGPTGTRTISWGSGDNCLSSSMVIAPAPPSGGAMVGSVHI
jgi:hypothetical protein